MTLPLRNLVVQMEIRGSQEADVQVARNAVISCLRAPNFVTLIAQGFMLDPSFDIAKALDTLNLTLVQSATICYALFRSSQSQQQRSQALLLLIRKLGDIGVSILGKDFKGGNNVRGVSSSGMVKVGIPPDPVVSERVLHELILWVSSPQDVNIPGIGSLQAVPEVNIFLSANMILSFNLDSPVPGGAQSAAGPGAKISGKGGSGGTGSSSISSSFVGLPQLHIELEEQGTGTKIGIAALMSELGSQCSSSADVFLQMCKFLCTSQKVVYDEEQIAGMIVEAVSHWSRPNQSYGDSGGLPGGSFMQGSEGGKSGLTLALLQTFIDSESGKDSKFSKEASLEPWNMEKILAGIKQCNQTFLTGSKKNIDWLRVASSVDQPRLQLLDDDSCELLVDIYKKLSGKPFPSDVLVKPWSNPVAQFNFMASLASKPINDHPNVDLNIFREKDTIVDIVDGGNDAVFNSVWASNLTYTTLMALARRGGGINGKVIHLMLSKASEWPEYTIISLAKLKDPDATNGVRSEVLHQLLPMFTGLAGTSPLSNVVYGMLSTSNPELLELLFRLTMRDATSATEVWEASTKLKASNESIFNKIERTSGNTGALDDLLSYWCVKADKSSFNLEKFVMAALHENTRAATGIFNFIQVRLNNLRLRANPEAGGVLSFESGAALLQALQNHIPMEKLRRVMHVLQQGFQLHRTNPQAAAAQQRQQQQAQAQQQQAVLQRTVRGNTFAASRDSAFIGQQQAGYQMGSGGGVNALAAGIGTMSIQQAQQQQAQQAQQGEMGGDVIIPQPQQQQQLDDFEAFAKKGPSPDVSSQAKQYFQRIYNGDISVRDACSLLQKMRNSSNAQEKETFMCMVLNLFDEYRFFGKYRKKELEISGALFGSLIDMGLLSGKTYLFAMRLVLEALNKDPKTPGAAGASHENNFHFGVVSLRHFLGGLVRTPRYCRDVTTIPHFSRECPELYRELLMILEQAAQQESSGSSKDDNTTSDVQTPPMDAMPTPGAGSVGAAGGLPGGASRGPTEPDNDSNKISGHTIVDLATFTSPYVKMIDQMVKINIESFNLKEPDDKVRDKVHFIMNNISQASCESRSLELAQMLTEDNIPWFASNIVEKRVSGQANFHKLYLDILSNIGNAALDKAITRSTYYSITKVLQSPTLTTSTADRSILRSLGMWLGQITLARNKPILQRHLNLKELLFWGFETGRLIAVVSFVVKVLEGIKESMIFRPPNPWLMSLLGVLRDLYETEDLKMNIKFEVQVLCKNTNIRIEDIPKTGELVSLHIPLKEGRTLDFNLAKLGGGSGGASGGGGKSPTIDGVSPVLDGKIGSTSPAGPSGVSGSLNLNGQGGEGTERTIIPNLASYITINPILLTVGAEATFRRVFCLALDRAIVETIQTAVEKAVSIVCVTAKHLILKDFAAEGNDRLMSTAAHNMVSSLAGSLVVVSCREALRIGIANHLRSLLASSIQDEEALEKIVRICANDNLELGCALIEKATDEKVTQIIDENLADAYSARQKARESEQPFIDPAFQGGGPTAGGDGSAEGTSSRFPESLPAQLKAAVGGLTQEQLSLYENYRSSLQKLSSSMQGAGGSGQGQTAKMPSPPLMGQDDAGLGMPPMPPGANVFGATSTLQQQQQQQQQQQIGEVNQEALGAFNVVLERIEQALQTLQQSGSNPITLSILPGDSELIARMRDIALVMQRIPSHMKADTAAAGAELVMRAMCDSGGTPSMLRLEALIGVLEILRDASGAPQSVTMRMGMWLRSFSKFVGEESLRKAHQSALLLLFRGKLLTALDLDMHFLANIDNGNNLLWVETALTIVRQCIVDGLATTTDFSNTFEAVSKVRPPNMTVRKQLQKWLTDLQSLVASQNAGGDAGAVGKGNVFGSPGQGAPGQLSGMVPGPGMPGAGANPGVAGGQGLGGGGTPSTAAGGPGGAESTVVREHVTILLERWLRMWTSANEQVFGQYLQLMHQYGVLKTEEGANRFFRIATELCVEACLKSQRPAPAGQTEDGSTTLLTFTVMDALSKLFLFLLRLADKEAADVVVRLNLLNRILTAIARVLVDDHEEKRNSKNIFDQRPYIRLLSELMADLGVCDDKTQEPNPAAVSLLSIYHQLFMVLSPSAVPGFAFAWLQLISSPHFMPQLLRVKEEKGWPYMHRLLHNLLTFLQPFLKSGNNMSDSIRKLYKGTLRVLVVLLHDFPEFLNENHLLFCDVIPSTCVQLRNLVLSAVPRSVRVPDPQAPNFKMESVQEIFQPARMPSNYASALGNLQSGLDAYLTTSQPVDFPTIVPNVLYNKTEKTYNASLLNVVVTYTAESGAEYHQNNTQSTPPGRLAKDSPAARIFLHLLGGQALPDQEGTFLVLNTIANQLRYPSSLTFFSQTLLLHVFEHGDREPLREAILRILLDRLVVHKPHPWGLVCTFMELIKNPRFGFWRRGFSNFSQEIETVFNQLAHKEAPK